VSVLTVNGHTHAENEVGIKIDHRVIEDKFKKPLSLVTRWTIVGALRSDGSSGALQSQIDALDAAYRDGGANYGDATFTANGHTHTLDDSASFSGVRCSAFGWMTGPWKMRTELVNRRAFYAVMQAEFRFSTEVIAYREEVQQIGTAGPKWRYMPSLIGQPQYQTLQLNTPIKYVQRGLLILRSSQPSPNASLFPTANMHQDQTRITEIAPQSITINGSGQVEEAYGVEWLYVAESYPALSLGTWDIPTI